MYSIHKVKRTHDQWLQEKGRILFTWNIVNPNGPTFSCVGLRQTGDGSQVEVFYRWMHFMGGEGYVLGFVDASANEIEFADCVRNILQHAFKHECGVVLSRFPLVSCVPSFVTLPGAVLNDSDVFDLISSSPEFVSADWGAQRYYLEKYGSRFFDRAAEETRNALEVVRANDGIRGQASNDFVKMTEIHRGNLEGFRDWKPNQYSPRAIAAGDAQAWWAYVSGEQFCANCCMQLANAWAGSIYQYKFADRSKFIAETFEDVRDFTRTFNHAMWPDSWDSEALLKGMGLPSMPIQNLTK